MLKIIPKLWNQCKIGFTAGQKFAYAAGLGLYVLSPIDLAPDFFVGIGQIDDFVAFVLMVKVVCAPTLRSADKSETPPIRVNCRVVDREAV